MDRSLSSSSGLSVLALYRLPRGDGHRRVLQARARLRAVGAGVGEPTLVVTVGEIAPGVRAARLLPRQRAGNNHFAEIEQVLQFQRRGQIGVVDPAAVVDVDPARALAQLADLVEGLL